MGLAVYANVPTPKLDVYSTNSPTSLYQDSFIFLALVYCTLFVYTRVSQNYRVDPYRLRRLPYTTQIPHMYAIYIDGWLRMGLLPPREFCRHILSCRELKAESFKRCLHSVLRGVSL